MTDSLASPGSLCRLPQAASPMLALEYLSDGRMEFVPFDAANPSASVEAESMAAFPRDAAVIGQIEDAARALAMRRRTLSAFRVFSKREEKNAVCAAAGVTVQSSAPSAQVETAMIFCAGLGTRLRPLTMDFPKPAVPFFGVPLIRFAMASIRRAGIRNLVVNTHHLPGVMEKTARAEAEAAGFTRISVSHEPVLMDTAGGLRDARRFMEAGPVLVVNGDAFISMDLGSFIRRHAAVGASASMAVAPPVPGAGFRAVESDDNGAVVRIRGIGENRPGLLPWHFLGVHVVTDDVFDAIPREGPRDINGEVYPAMIAAGKRIQALPVPVGAWADLGTPRRYYGACLELISGCTDLSALGGASPLNYGRILRSGDAPDLAVQPASFVGEKAVVGSGVQLESSIIQNGASVGKGASVIRSVLLPGARVDDGQTVQDVILWNGGSMPIC